MKRLYPERRLFRIAEQVFTRIEGLFNRSAASSFNPFYQLGTISIFLLIVIILTGIYLTLLYRPNVNDAYASVSVLSATWLGSLIRSIHHYASDALVVTILLHALKMLVSDRFWGGRWLSWVSGWVLLAIIWLIGAMGYWLVWDQRAQWLTEYSAGLFGGAVQLAFATPAALSRTITFFVIVLFLHIFLPVGILSGLFIHMLRLQRVRIWAPRLFMAEIGLALLIVALWQPVTSAPQANPLQLITNITLNWWYLGFLPLMNAWGSPAVWAGSVLIIGGLALLPWLARGRHLGPAIVIDSHCTGCAICAQECPYGAIEMRARAAGDRYETLAVINPKLCTGCGICVGTCATIGVELPGLPAGALRERMVASLTSEHDPAHTPMVIFTCQRHTALGTFPDFGSTASVRTADSSTSGATAALEPAGFAIQTITIADTDAHKQPAVIVPVPCVGMIQPELVRDALEAHSAGVAVVSCPTNDCSFREGPRWATSRLDKRQKLTRQGVHLFEVAPGDAQMVKHLIRDMPQPSGTATDAAHTAATPVPFVRRLIGILAGFIIVLLISLNGLFIERPIVATPAGQSKVRLALEYAGRLRVSPTQNGAANPGNVDIEAVKAASGERIPLHIRIVIEGLPSIEREYVPSGLRRDGTIYAYEEWMLPPGRYHLQLTLMDDATTWRPGYDGEIELRDGQVGILRYNSSTETFQFE